MYKSPDHIQTARLQSPAFEHNESFRARSANPDAVIAAEGEHWGWLPLLSLTTAFALLVVAIADTRSRAGVPDMENMFWAGLLVMFVPIVLRLLGENVPRRERLGLVLVLGLGLYLIKVLHSPLAFTFHDEFIHWRTLLDVQYYQHLFHENSLITVSPFFPGLQLATSAVMSLSGFDVYTAGIIVLAAARIIVVLSLFLLAEEVSDSSRVAGIASAVYMGNPNFLFFTAQYAYESLALAFAMLTIYAVARRSRVRGSHRIALNIALLVILCAVVTSHHLTSYALVAFLVLWTVTPFVWQIIRACGQWYAGKGTLGDLGNVFRQQAGLFWQEITGAAPVNSDMLPGETTLLAIVVCAAWLIYVATLVVGYLAPVLGAAISELLRLIAGELPSRQLFRDHAGQRPPVWEQVTGFGSVLCVLVGLPLGALHVWRRYRNNPLAITLVVGAMAYPAALALRFTQAGAETSNRSSEFLFMPIAIVLAIGAVHLLPSPRFGWVRVPLLGVWASVLFLGGVIVGSPPWARLPADYRVSADTRSIEPQGIEAAEWARDQLGRDNRVGTDRINRLLMASYGEQRVVTNLSDGINVAYVFFAPQVGPAERALLQQTKTHYLVVDHRLTTQLPLAGVYFEMSEPLSNQHTEPMTPEMLNKFDDLAISRLFDSGDIVIYDVGALANEP